MYTFKNLHTISRSYCSPRIESIYGFFKIHRPLRLRIPGLVEYKTFYKGRVWWFQRKSKNKYTEMLQNHADSIVYEQRFHVEGLSVIKSWFSHLLTLDKFLDLPKPQFPHLKGMMIDLALRIVLRIKLNHHDKFSTVLRKKHMQKYRPWVKYISKVFNSPSPHTASE